MQLFILATALLLAIVPQITATGGFGQVGTNGQINDFSLTAECGGTAA
jgi:hypothetical protein